MNEGAFTEPKKSTLLVVKLPVIKKSVDELANIKVLEAAVIFTPAS